MTHDFTLERIESVAYACSAELEGIYKLSPFVWRAASAVEHGDRMQLYYSIADRHVIRATIRRH